MSQECGGSRGDARSPVRRFRKALEGPREEADPVPILFSQKKPSLSGAVVTSLLRHGRVIFVAGSWRAQRPESDGGGLLGGLRGLRLRASRAPLAASWTLLGWPAS